MFEKTPQSPKVRANPFSAASFLRLYAFLPQKVPLTAVIHQHLTRKSHFCSSSTSLNLIQPNEHVQTDPGSEIDPKLWVTGARLDDF